MIGTYASAALICVVSLLVGRAVFALAGRDRWSWLEPAVGFGAVLTVTGLLARAPGHGTSATLGVIGLVLVAGAVAWRLRPTVGGVEVPSAGHSPSAGGHLDSPRAAWQEGVPVAVVVLLVLAI